MKLSPAHIITLILGTVFWYSCERDINIELPENASKLVVDGKIEQGQPPYVSLTKSVPYFDETSLEALESSFVRDAEVSVFVEGTEFPLELLCSDNIPQQFLPQVATLIGSSPEQLAEINFCIYTIPIQDLLSGNVWVGEEGKSYRLEINWQDEVYEASTFIHEPIAFDSTWFIIEQYNQFGYIHALLTDPDTVGNQYRFYARRINKDSTGAPLDPTFVTDFGSAFDDQYFNGQEFEFNFRRGLPPGVVEEESTETTEPFFFAENDTVVFKFCTLDDGSYKFVRAMEIQFFSNGNPFAAPADAPSNVSNNALGVWAGYGVYMDTLICVEREP
jgi:hypothetical protein